MRLLEHIKSHPLIFLYILAAIADDTTIYIVFINGVLERPWFPKILLYTHPVFIVIYDIGLFLVFYGIYSWIVDEYISNKRFAEALSFGFITILRTTSVAVNLIALIQHTPIFLYLGGE